MVAVLSLITPVLPIVEFNAKKVYNKNFLRGLEPSDFSQFIQILSTKIVTIIMILQIILNKTRI